MTETNLDTKAGRLAVIKGWLPDDLQIVLLTLAFFSIYMPWKWCTALVAVVLLLLVVNRRELQLPTGWKIPAALLLAWLVIFSFISIDVSRSFKGGYDMLRGSLFFPAAILLAGKVETRGRQSWPGLVAVLVILGHFFFPQEFYGGLFFGYHVNPNNTAVLLVAAIILAVPTRRTLQHSGTAFFIQLVGSGTGLFLLMLTRSRGAWLGLAVALVVYCLASSHLRTTVKVAIASCGTLLLAAFLLLFNIKGGSLSLREGLWSGLLDVTWRESRWFGYGINTVKDVIDANGLVSRTAHNLELEIFVSSGLVGLLLFAAWLFYLLRFLLQFRYDKSSVFWLGVCGIVAFVVMGQFDLKFSSMRFIGTMSFFLGLVCVQIVPQTAGQTAADAVRHD